MKLAEVGELACLTEDLSEAITRADRPGLQYAAIFSRRRVRDRPLIRPCHGVANRDLDGVRVERELNDVDRNFVSTGCRGGLSGWFCGSRLGSRLSSGSGSGGAGGDR